MITKNTTYDLLFSIGTVGLTPTATTSKDGAAFAAPSGVVTEVGTGWYKLALTAGDMNADNIAIHITTVGYNPLDFLINTDVASAGGAPTAAENAAAVRTNLAVELARVDTTISSRSTIGDIPTAATTAAAVRTNLTTELGRIDVATGSRMATFTYTAPDNASVTAIKAKTDNLPAAPAAVSDVPTAATTAAAVRTNLATELARVDATVSSRNATTPPTAAANASAVRTELATELARVDATISSRNATAPDNASIVSIVSKLPTAGAKMAGEGTTAKNLDQIVVSGGTAPTAEENATAVRTEITTELARIDVAISTRLASLPEVPPLLTILGETEMILEDVSAVLESESADATFTLDEL